MMNEKMIRGIAFDSYSGKHHTFDEILFAKLIINECIKEVSQYHSTTICDGFIPENPTREHYEEWAYIKGINQGYNDAVNQIVYGLKEHFGVK
jgi:hypothetical protein